MDGQDVRAAGRLRGLVPAGRRSDEGGTGLRGERDLVRALAAFSGFAVCDEDDLLALVRVSRAISLPARWTALHEGTPADACYVVLAGHVVVRRDGVELASLGPGSVVGEAALLGRSLRQASIVTSTPVQVLRVEGDVLAALLRSHPSLASCVGAAYASHQAADAARAAV